MPLIVPYSAASITLTPLIPKLAAVGVAPLASCRVMVTTSPTWVTPAVAALAKVMPIVPGVLPVAALYPIYYSVFSPLVSLILS
jgi:hypothetical protein